MGIVLKELDEVVDLLQKADKLAVFTGAGMSTESGIPKFRSQNGYWKGGDFEEIATPYAVEHLYGKFHAFYSERLRLLQTCHPHEGYKILNHWEEKGKLKTVITQNVDGLHQQAGNKQVLLLRGNLQTFRCHHCNESTTKENFLNLIPCKKCESKKLRPNVVLLGEALSRETLSRAEEAIISSDVLLVIGTSLTMAPANQFQTLTKGTIICINREPVSNKSKNHIHLNGSAKEILIEINDRLM